MAKYISVVAINVSVFLLMIGVGLIVALLPQRIMTLSASVSDVGLLASAYAIPNLLLQIPIGNLSDKFGYKFFIVGGYLLCGVTGFLYFFADTPSLFFCGRFIQGIAEAPIWALAPALLSIQYAVAKGKHMGIYNASLHCGLTIGSLMSIAIFRFWHGNESFLLFAALSILGGLITAIWVENPTRHSTGKMTTMDARTVRSLLLNRINFFVFLGIALYGAGYGVFITIVPAFLIHTRDATQTTIGVFFAFFYIALSLSQVFAGAWSDRKGRKPAMIFGLMMAALGIVAFHRCAYPIFIVALTMASLGWGIFCVSSMAFLNERVPTSLKGTISGAFYFCWGAGYFLGPLFMGRIGSSISYHTGFSFFAGLILVQVVAMGIFVKRRHGALP